MSELIILCLMAVFALVPFGISLKLCRVGKLQQWLWVLAILALIFGVLSFATNGSLGLDPLRAYAWAMLFALPAMLGAGTGGLFGLLFRWRAARRDGE